MKRFTCLWLIILTFGLGFSQSTNFPIDPIRISDNSSKHIFTKSIYALSLQASESDTALFLQKPKRMSIISVDSVGRHELEITFQIDSNFVDYQEHTFALLDSVQKQKGSGVIDVLYSAPPIINKVTVRSGSSSETNSLRLAMTKKTFANIRLVGNGLFETTSILFDDPHIKVINDPGWKNAIPPHELHFGIEVDASDIELGTKAFRVKNKYAMESFGSINLVGAQPPTIVGAIEGFIADGREKQFDLIGRGFSKGVQAALVPADGFVNAVYKSSNKVHISVAIPTLEQSKSYRLAITNADGQSDTSSYFIARTTPLSSAKAIAIDQKSIFRDKKVNVMFVVDTRDGWRLSRKRSYEVNIEGDRFPIIRVANDSTCEAIIKLGDGDGTSALNQHLFSINEVDRTARWRGMLKSRPAPKIYYLSPNRIIHPTDTLSLVIKGKNLLEASVVIEDPEVTFQILENRGDLIRILAVAGEHVTFGTYPLEIRLEGVPFQFPQFNIDVKPWQPFSEFVTFYISSTGDVQDSVAFKGPSKVHALKAQDALIVKVNTQKIKQEFGIQKLHISGVLTDSSSAVRAESYNGRTIQASHGAEIVTWRWRVREKIRSGDRIEITLKNSSGRNRSTEYFSVEPHWSEAFHGSTSFILFKIPFGGDAERAEILNSIGIGLSYQPYIKKDFLEFDASFLLGNATKENSDLSVEVSFGLSAILWQYLQVGIGSNITGKTFSKSFLFVGTRFKLPTPF
jgi:hypothetical protein